MPLEDNIYRENFGAPYQKTAFDIAMIDENGTLRSIPFPPVEGLYGEDTVYGVRLMVNPSSISNNMARIVTRTQTMVGFIEEHWGEELDTITFQGSTAAFVTGAQDLREARSERIAYQGVEGFYEALDLNNESYKNAPGLTTSRRRLSVSYRQFKRLIDLFRINGCIYDQYGFVSQRLYVMLAYGYSAYRGFFESVDVTEDATNPYRFIYTITFKSEETLYSYINQSQTSV
jgi:hypothetical protein